ncbi:MAG: hypothetical protein JRJ85_00660 [Deltaproteobacteria bacterium]|nr:hypothetical protein [Deltaproteobacteria bacterium]
MNKIYSYSKITDEFTTYTVAAPDYKEGDAQITELCVISGTTYISVPDTVILPEQPSQITLSEVTPDETLYQHIEKVSCHIQLINQRVADRILTMTEGETLKRAFGYIPVNIKTINEKTIDAEISMKTSPWWQKTDDQLNTYIDNNWDEAAKRKNMFKKLVKQVTDIARRAKWDD